MLGIVKNECYVWCDTISRLLPGDLLLVFTFGCLVMRDFKIKKVSVPWSACFVHFGTDLIVVLSLGYLATNWVERYSNYRHQKYMEQHARNH